MPLICLKNISLSYGVAPVLDNIELNIDSKERLCIMGRNGMGKSTLLKLIHGDIHADRGEVIRQQSVRTALLTQDVAHNLQGSVYEIITGGLGEQGKLLSKYQQLTTLLASHHDDDLLTALQNIQQELDNSQSWDLSHQVAAVISRLQLPETRQFSTLSGGLKRRVLLGRALIQAPNVLLLDEPTNHLQISAIEWLEDFLNDFKGTVIFISHDRSFMQKVATRFIELDRGKITAYPGNYQQYIHRKQQALVVEAKHDELFDKKLQQEEIWLRQGIKARRTRNEGRVRKLEKLREVRQSRRSIPGKAKLQLQQATHSGKVVIEADNIHFAFDDKLVVKNFSTRMIRGDKIGFIGPNGVGKTTMIQLLLGELKPQQGTIQHGTKLKIAYFDQLRQNLDEEKSVADNVSYGDQYINVNGKSVHIISYLADFLFSSDRARMPVKVLSGGERNRLLLARLFTQPTNLLVLDEPTNDLDIETLELLEELLVDYSGTLLLVSHDRTFLNNVVTSTMVFDGNGNIDEYIGGYDDWLRQRQRDKTTNVDKSSKSTVSTNAKIVHDNRKKIAALERKIAKIENHCDDLKQLLATPELYQPEQAHKLQQTQQALQQSEVELTQLMDEWEKLYL